MGRGIEGVAGVTTAKDTNGRRLTKRHRRGKHHVTSLPAHPFCGQVGLVAERVARQDHPLEPGELLEGEQCRSRTDLVVCEVELKKGRERLCGRPIWDL